MRALDNPESCFVCRRRADALGVGSAVRTGWICTECGPILGTKAYAMTDRQFDEYEVRALEAAGQEAGAWLDGIGRTDLATLTPDEWAHFLRLVVTNFGTAIRRKVDRGAVMGWVPEPLPAHLTTDELEADEAA